MVVEPYEASLFRASPLQMQEALLKKGIIPTNDYFITAKDGRAFWHDPAKIILLFGSYGSGKSVTIVDKLIEKAQTRPYFRCYFGRKILEDVRGTVFKTITDRIKELKREADFRFSDAPNGSMIIQHLETKNEFIPFGANNAASLKSIKDPTDFFLEEMDQFSFEDFGLIYSRLRTEKAQTQLFGAFNTERIYQSHWIRKVLFDGEFADQASRYKVNYTENHFIDQADYYKKLQLIANGNAAVLNAIANGEWGVVKTGGEFLKQFDETKHVGPVSYVPGVVYLSWDENVNPYVTCTIWQVRGTALFQIGEVLSKSPNNNAPKAADKVADWLRQQAHQDAVFVCGDPSASKRSTIDEDSKSFYDKVIETLNKRGYRTVNKVMRSAPEVALSGAFINAILEQSLYGWSITISDRCFGSIEDYLLTKEDAEGKPMPEKKKHPVTEITYETRGHCLDTLRYLALTIMSAQWQQYKGNKGSGLRGKMGYFG